MRHLNKGRKLGRTASHRKATMIALATALFEHKKIHTTEMKAKELKTYAEKLITKAKRALQREKQGLLPDGQTIDIHQRRQVGRFIKNKSVLEDLFDNIAPACEERNGGYTRVIKTYFRRGDNASMAIIELVDWSNPQDGNISLKGKKKNVATTAPKKTTNKVDETKEIETTQTSADVLATENVEELSDTVVDTQTTDDAVEEVNAQNAEVQSDETNDDVETLKAVTDASTETDVANEDTKENEETTDNKKSE